jgi:CheY-like chemotaxis protein
VAPAAAQQAAGPAAGQAGEPAQVAAGVPRRVLLVEDNESTLRIMKRVLLNLKYDVTTAATLADAVGHAGRTKFDVVISDLGLPDGMGYDLMRQIRAHQDVAGIAISGYGMEEDLRRSAEAGFAEHLTKPVDLQQLTDALGRVMASARTATPARLAGYREVDPA